MEPGLTANWWALALRGVAAIIFGLAAFLIPGITLAALVWVFGAYALVDGILSIAAAVRGHRERQNWWAMIFEGIVGILTGVIAFLWTGITAIALVFVIGTWAMLTGILEISAAVALRKQIQHEWLLVLAGIASLLLGVMLFAAPAAGAIVLVWWIGAYALVFGIALLALAFRVRAERAHHAAPPEAMAA